MSKRGPAGTKSPYLNPTDKVFNCVELSESLFKSSHCFLCLQK